MCGIAGVLRPDASPQPLVREVRRLGRWLLHRGPDAWGEWAAAGIALGHTRLSILDRDGGRQPMSDGDGSVHVVFNGEIYNHAALRRALQARGHSFASDHSDTEVLVHGWREWGDGLFERLDGMFAVAIWDAGSQRLVLARDRIGIKPLFLAPLSDGGVAFASELKALVGSGLIAAELDEDAVADFFLFRAPLQPASAVRGVEALPAGTMRVFERNGRSSGAKPYWTPRPSQPGRRPAHEVENELLNVLDTAVRDQLVSDVPLGLFLSGGVDSSLVAALAARHSRPAAFTIGVDGPLDETDAASRVAHHLGLDLHVLRIDGRSFRDHLDDWAWTNDVPVADPSALALMLLARHARERGLEVMLTGEGADELFGGYRSYLRYAAFDRLRLAGRAASLASSLLPGKLSDYVDPKAGGRFWGTAHLTSGRERRSLFTGDLQLRAPLRLERATRFDGSQEAVRRATLFDQRTRLPSDVLMRTDLATMAWSMEARVPFLSNRVVDFAHALPDSLLLRRFETKWLLKRLAARFVPREVVYRPKRGFDLPLGAWLSSELRERVHDRLSARRLPFFDYRWLASRQAELESGDRSATPLVWAWLVFEEWHRQWMSGAVQPRVPLVAHDPSAWGPLSDDAQSRLA